MELYQLNLRALCAAAKATLTIASPLGELHLEPTKERLVQATTARATTADLVLLNATRVTMRAGDKGDAGDFFPRDFLQLATVLERVLEDISPRPSWACCVDELVTVQRPQARLVKHTGHALLAAPEPYLTLSGLKARSVFCGTCNALLVGWAR